MGIVVIAVILSFQIGSLKDYYLLEHKHVHKRSTEINFHYHDRLTNEPQVSTYIYIFVITHLFSSTWGW